MDGSGARTRRRRARVAALGIGLALAAAGLSLRRAQFDPTLEQMLPPDSPAQRMVAFVQEAGLADTVAITLEVRDAANDGGARLLDAADDLAASLGPPWVTRVMTASAGGGMAAAVSFFPARAAEILDAADREALAARLEPAAVERSLREGLRRLMTPEGLFGSGDLRTDPLGIGRQVMGRLAALAEGADLAFSVRRGHFVSADGRHALIVAETPARLTDSTEARELLAYLDERLAGLPPEVTGSVLSGHARTVSNEDAIRRDVGVVFALAAAAFVALFALYFRDPRALLVFLLPFVSAVLAMAVAARLFPRLSFLVLGFGPVMAGIAVDYGIFVYVAVRHGRDTGRAVRRVARPIVGAALTTAAIFVAFFFARVPVYRQLSVFALLCVAIALAMALGVLPLALRRRPDAAPEGGPGNDRRGTRRDAVAAAAFVLLLGAAVALGRGVRLDADVTALDGTAPEVLAAEDRFRDVWGGSAREAILAVAAADEETARAAADRIHRRVAAAHGPTALIGLSSIWPAAQTRAENLRGWQEFWSAERVAALRETLAAAGAELGFEPDAFDPFFAELQGPSAPSPDPGDNPLFAMLRDRFVQDREGTVHAFSYFADEPEVRASVRAAAREEPGATVFSRAVLTEALAETFEGEMRRLVALSGGLILLVALAFLRSARGLLAAMAPAVGGLLAVFGLMGLRGGALNLANLMAGIVVVGLCIDFGIHRLHAWQQGGERIAHAGITLGAATTLIGAGSLLFARHPALYAVGWTLTIGVAAGYATALGVVPALCRLLQPPAAGWGARRPLGRAAGLVLLAVLAAGAGCATWRPLPDIPADEPVDRALVPTPFRTVSSVVFRFRPRWYLPRVAVTGIGTAEIDPEAGEFRVAGLTPMGVTLFDVERADGRIEGRVPLPGLPDADAVARRIGEDIAAVYLDPPPAAAARVAVSGDRLRVRRETPDGRTDLFLDRATGRIIERRDFEGRRRVRTVRFEDYRPFAGGAHPGIVRLHNRRGNYRLTLRLREIAPIEE